MTDFDSPLAAARARNSEAFELVRAAAAAAGRQAQGVGGVDIPFFPYGSQAANYAIGQAGLVSQAAEQYRHNAGWFHAGLTAICKRIAGQPIHVAERETPASRQTKARRKKSWMGRDYDYKTWCKLAMPGSYKAIASNVNILEHHAFIDTLNKPNPIMIRWSLIYVTVASLLITGKSYWWLHKAKDGQPQIWPVPTHWLTPRPDAPLYSSWYLQPAGLASRIEVPGEEIAYFHTPDPGNPFNAIAPLQAAAKSVIVDEYLSESQKRAFLNGVMPGYAITIGRVPDEAAFAGVENKRVILNDRQRNDILAAFKARYRGVYKTDEPLILDGFIEDIKKITMSPREMDWMKSKAATKDEILQMLGVNPIVMGQIEGANKATASVADDNFAKCTINPIIELLSEFMTIFVIPRFSGGQTNLLVFIEESSGVDPADVKANYELGLKIGAVSRNEFRSNILQLPPIEGGDNCYIPGNQELVPILPEGENVDDSGGTGDAGQETETSAADDSESTDAAEKQIAAAGHLWHCLAKHVARSALAKVWGMKLDRMAASFGNEIRAVLQTKAKQIAAALRKNISEHGLAHGGLTDMSMPMNKEFADDLREAMRKPAKELLLAGASHEWELYRPRTAREIAGIVCKAPAQSNQRIQLPGTVQSGIDAHADEFLNQPWLQDLAQDVRESIADDLKAGIADGLSGDEVAANIAERLGDDAGVRANRIAQTESTALLNSGADSVRNELAANGLVAGREWAALDDQSVRETHAEASGQQVGNDEDFDIGGEPARYPGDVRLSAANRINCRCTCLSVFPDESSPLPEKARAFIFKCLSGIDVARLLLKG